MKANVRYGVASLLLVVACNRPDNDLFSDGSQQPVEHENGGSSSGSVSVAMGGAATAGTATAAGGSTTQPTTGGMGAVAGTLLDQGTSGTVNPPDMKGMAGADPGTAGTGTAGTGTVEPVDPVCGNGILDAGEECDDAGHTGQDGCDAGCKVVCAQYGAGTLGSDDHHCYNGYDQADFEGAQQKCADRGAHLATITSEAENEIARALVHESKWIGGYEDVSLTAPGNGTYRWLGDEPFTYTSWAEREPNRGQSYCGGNARCYEHCIALLGDGTWADRRCDLPDGYVCEWEPAGTVAK